MKKQYKIILIAVIVNIVLLSSLLAVYFTVWKPNLVGEEGNLTISIFNEETLVYNITQLEEFPSITEYYLLQGNPTENASYTGISLYYIITEIANITENVNVKITASDLLSVSFNLNELSNFQNITIAYKKDGEYLKSQNQGGDGPLRLIVPQSYTYPYEWNAQSCLKYVVLIEILSID
ncbi:MAG: hypothetical protein FK734_08765 [Asgard group archaeon]|nr:hypothetical protein [Asgard group archaeon]